MGQIKQTIRGIQFLYSAVLGGSSFFLLLCIFLSESLGPLAPLDKQSVMILLAVASIAGISGIYAGLVVFRARVKDILRLSLPEKLEVYKSAMILRVAMLEGATFFFVVIYLISGSFIALVEGAVFIALMGIYFPTVMRISQEIGQDPRELE
jgi:hypothetical protein